MFLLPAVNTLEISEKEMSSMAMDWNHTLVLAMPLLTVFGEGTKCLMSVGFQEGSLEMGAVNGNIP